MRADDSLLSVAFDDPVLRADGLASDTVDDVLTYFKTAENNSFVNKFGEERIAGEILRFFVALGVAAPQAEAAAAAPSAAP